VISEAGDQYRTVGLYDHVLGVLGLPGNIDDHDARGAVTGGHDFNPLKLGKALTLA
jgi:hypothetical protein